MKRSGVGELVGLELGPGSGSQPASGTAMAALFCGRFGRGVRFRLRGETATSVSVSLASLASVGL